MLKSIFSSPYSKLYIVGDNADWAIDEEARQEKLIAEKLGIKVQLAKREPFFIPQAVHYVSQFALIYERIYRLNNKISVDYFHGKGEQSESLSKCLKALKSHHSQISIVRVSTSEMEEFIKSSGIDPTKVMRIPIGVDTEIFTPQTEIKKKLIREKLNIPSEAFIIGSFQKDGTTKSGGLEPKLIKGPDIFLKVIDKLKDEIPNLWVLLSGPDRGYVKNGLEKMSVPYRYVFAEKYPEVSTFYDALDLYLITSREEGGPKACLEALAKGIPLVTTAVGQCRDLIENVKNAMMTKIDDIEGLTQLTLRVAKEPILRQNLIKSGFITAEENSYESQQILWKTYFKKLINS